MNVNLKKSHLLRLAVIAGVAIACAIPFFSSTRRASRPQHSLQLSEELDKSTVGEAEASVPVIRFSDLNFPDGKITIDQLPASLKELLGKRVRMSGYASATMEPREATRVLPLREHLEIPADGPENVREYAAVELRTAGAFSHNYYDPVTFEGVLEMRDSRWRDYESYSFFWLTDAVEGQQRRGNKGVRPQ